MTPDTITRDTPHMIELTAEQCRAILEEGRIAHIACLWQGEPYVTPMSYVVIGDTVYFRTRPGRRVEALKIDPKVCVEVSILRSDIDWDSIVFWGTVTFVADPNLEADVIAALLHKYEEPVLGISRPRILHRDYPVMAIIPDRMTGRASGGGLSERTLPGRL